MKNGTEIRAFIEESIQYLDGVDVKTFYAEELPSATDDRLGTMVARFMADKPGDRALFHQLISVQQRAVFGIFGHRAATLAAREESREQLRVALAAAGIANYEVPQNRRVEVALAVYYHCARKLGINTVDLFVEAGSWTSRETAVLFQQYGRRSDVTLAKFGWREIKTPDGIRFKFSWG